MQESFPVLGSFAVQFGDHLRYWGLGSFAGRDHLRSGMISFRWLVSAWERLATTHDAVLLGKSAHDWKLECEEYTWISFLKIASALEDVWIQQNLDFLAETEIVSITNRHISGSIVYRMFLQIHLNIRGGEWYPENRGSRKFLIRSRNLGNFCDESRSLVFHVFLSVSESRIFFGRSWSLGLASLAEVLRQRLSRWESRISVAENTVKGNEALGTRLTISGSESCII